MEVIKVTTNNQAESLLKSLTENDLIVELIQMKIDYFAFQSNSSLNLIWDDLQSLLEMIRRSLFGGLDDLQVEDAVFCCVFNRLHDDLWVVFKDHFSKRDKELYERCLELCGQNLSPLHLGGRKDYTMSFSATIVELSLLDKYKSPIEKLFCLQSTYDLLFAEFKTVLVSMISKFSDKENDFPVISNDEVIPLLLFVMVKSKLFYLYSNFAYIRLFSENFLKKNRALKDTFNVFEIVLQKLLSLPKEIPNLDQINCLESSLSLEQIIELSLKYEAKSSDNEKPSILDEEKRRVVQLINNSTMEYII